MRGPRIEASDLRDAQIAIVVSITWTGRTWRLGTRSLAGSDWQAFPGLVEVPTLTDEISLSGGGASDLSVPLAFVLPASVQARIDAGHLVEDIAVEVAEVWHRNGTGLTAWSARRIHAAGDLTGAQWGAPDRPSGYLAGTLRDSPYRVERPIVPRDAEITPTTAPTSTESAGTRYPLVFGAPIVDATTADSGPRSPVLTESVGNIDYTVASLGWTRATQVTLRNAAGAGVVYPLLRATDGLGRQVTVANVAGAVASGASFTSSWDQGAALTPFSTTAIPGLVAAYLLTLGGADIDLPEWVRVGTLLGGEVAGYVDDWEAEAWEVARDLLTSLPVALRRGPDGWAPCIIDPALAESLAAQVVREGQGWTRDTQWQVEEANAVAEVEVGYVRETVSVGADNAYNGPIPHAWVQHLTLRSKTAATLAWSWTAASAYRAAAWLARSQSLGWEVSAWQCPPHKALPHAGDWVIIAEEDGYDSYALVVRRTVGEDAAVDYTLARPRGL